MDNEIAMMRQQIDETRTALTDKLEALEQRVMDTVQGASTAVAESVASVKGIIHDTVQTVKDSVQDTVDTVKHTLDLKGQVDRRPWTMLAGATALGFLGGYLLRGSRMGQAGEDGRGASTALASRARTAVARNGAAADPHPVTSDTAKGANAATVKAPQEPSLLAKLGDTFEPEISQLKGLAVGALLGIVRDVVTQSVPEPMERQVEEVIDSITVKLGGQPLRGRLLPRTPDRERWGRVENHEDHPYREQRDSLDSPPWVLKKA